MASGSAAEAAVIHHADGFELRFLEVGSAGVIERRDALATCWATRFEDVPPVRQFPSYRGQRSFPGEYFAACTGRHVGFESWLERDQLMILDFSPRVRSFAAQPFWLSWPSGGKIRRHAPDFFVRMVDGRGVVVDVRADDRIKDEDAAAFAVTAAACESVGWGYRRVGTVDPVLSANVRWLAGYRHRRCLNDAHRDLLMEGFSHPSSLLAGVEAVGEPLAVLPSLFHLMWTGVLVADLVSAPLSGGSVVRVAGGGR
ncbi:TnsA-like heteromeric transposase endonuclease subunit [Rhodococcus opacus]|uniref:TnsA-like heteromeric transposase endonuclease subunit n=1 Tax=Rhodococcus opacus TaxID=37919 RepID=UPI0029CA1B40|nr:TnsA-like heteromeric transposase endonuclease subunit [Rhodococcus opacus]